MSLLVSPAAQAQEPVDPPQRTYGAQIVVRETHVGLAGYVFDSTGKAVLEAEIRAFPDAMGRSDEALMRRSHHYTRSEADGAFFLPLVPGRYAVRVNQPGFSVTTMQVVVPPSGGRCIAVWLEPPHARRRMRDSSCSGL